LLITPVECKGIELSQEINRQLRAIWLTQTN